MNSSRKSRKRLWIILGAVAAVLIAGAVFVARALSTPDKLDPSQLGKAEVGDIARSVVATSVGADPSNTRAPAEILPVESTTTRRGGRASA